jgi:hypothetical protein
MTDETYRNKEEESLSQKRTRKKEKKERKKPKRRNKRAKPRISKPINHVRRTTVQN